MAQSEVVLDPIVIVLATAAGALIGTSVGILILRRKLRPPVTEAQFAEMKSKLQAGESSLAAASASLEDLRKEFGLQQKALLQSAEDLKKRQAQLDIASAEFALSTRAMRSEIGQNSCLKH